MIAASNDWFQNRSMGGFGALNFSKQVGADTVLSMVPQYSISRGKVPFENRWADEARNVSFAHDYIDRSHDPVCETFVFYDMFHAADKKHVDLIRRSRRIFEIRLPFIGHEGVPAPILKEVVIAAAEGRASDIRLRSREIYRDIKKGLPEYYFYLATQQRSIKPASKAALLTKAVEIDPSNQNMQRGLASALIAAGMFEGAAAVLNKLAKRNPSDGELYFRLAAGLDAAGELAAAKSACETAVLTAPKSRWAWNLLAKLRLRDGDIARALACQDLAILIHPDRLYYGHKARILERFGRFEEACECGSRAVEMAPHNAVDWHSYAKALRSRGRPQEAATAARETLRLAPLPFYASFLDEIEKETATIAVAPAP